jgi:hypothetical protein
MGYMKSSIYCCMETRLYYGSMWLKIGNAQQLLVDVSILNFSSVREKGYGIYGKVNLLPYINQALVCS